MNNMEFPEWAYRLSDVFRSPSSTPDAVQKSVAMMAEKILDNNTLDNNIKCVRIDDE